MLVHPVVFFQSFSRYEQLNSRVHRQVNSPAAQAKRQTVIVRQSSERLEDWDKLIEQLDAEESVRVTLLGDGVAQLRWTNQHSC
ncbi:DUF1654 domain-containing protein [Pseudomonas sp. PB120]|uniref:DUF1654 domain-containing protein n=1 Tax=Pseudomonas sp. PB120 TaxID=2494700 RepID=UPI0012FD9196|nr:DUF1654 domain-containing protein [Pseudomonas sp. PB120]MVV51894.1 DUF1654 domain-containing protein [Pseudomonas sp. PB120]